MTGLDRALPVERRRRGRRDRAQGRRASGRTRSRACPRTAREIIVCRGNFHGRSITIVGLLVRGAVPRRLRPVSARLRRRSRSATPRRSKRRSRRTPPRSWSSRSRAKAASSCRRTAISRECARICREHRVLLICDEIQTGLGRTGKHRSRCEHDDVKPDGVILGKALGGGLLPVSAFVATDDVMQVFTPGRPRQHVRRQSARVGRRARRARRARRRGLSRARRSWARGCSRELRKIESPLITRRARPRPVHRHRGRHQRSHRARGRRPAARARHPVEGHARHRRAHRAAAHRSRARTLAWAVGEIRAVFVELTAGCGAAGLATLARDTSARRYTAAHGQARARRAARRRDQLARAVRLRGGERALRPERRPAVHRAAARAP